MDGYGHPGYAASLAEFGSVQPLSACGGWILKRQIPGFNDYDAMGCYPLFTCRDWTRLQDDFDHVANDFVSLFLVTDPFGDYTESFLHHCFDRVTQFKKHFIVDLNLPVDSFISKHHRYYARKAARDVSVEFSKEPAEYVDEWVSLYNHVISRHRLTGIKCFSKQAFDEQLRVPGIVMLRAFARGELVGAHLWYIQEERAYSHLAAMSPWGYELMASYALYWFAIEYFSGKVRWLDLGSVAGVTCDSSKGLDRFKKGWSSNTRIAYFCSRIFNPARYREITEAKAIGTTAYFPAYRSGEFV